MVKGRDSRLYPKNPSNIYVSQYADEFDDSLVAALLITSVEAVLKVTIKKQGIDFGWNFRLIFFLTGGKELGAYH